MSGRVILFSLLMVCCLRADPAGAQPTQTQSPSAAPRAQAQTPKAGDSLGTITTIDGKTYADAKLAVIEPDGISILYSGGGAKLTFTNLSPDTQKEFGYDSEKSEFYAREQQYLLKIDRLETENAELRKRLEMAVAPQQQERQAVATQRATVVGYKFFLNDLENQSDRRHEPHGIILSRWAVAGNDRGGSRTLCPTTVAGSLLRSTNGLREKSTDVWSKPRTNASTDREPATNFPSAR